MKYNTICILGEILYDCWFIKQNFYYCLVVYRTEFLLGPSTIYNEQPMYN
jgi:hypothetical protein